MAISGNQANQQNMKEIGDQAGLDQIGSGHLFLFRENGVVVRELLKERLLKTPKNEALVVCFSKDDRLDASFADEALVNLVLEVAEGNFGDRGVLFQGLTEHNIFNIEASIEKRRLKLALLLVEDDHSWRCIGHLEKNLRETLDIVAERDGLTAPELAEQFDLAINTASNRLKKLHSQRLVRREGEISEKGLQYIYFFWQWNS